MDVYLQTISERRLGVKSLGPGWGHFGVGGRWIIRSKVEKWSVSKTKWECHATFNCPHWFKQKRFSVKHY